MIKMVNELEATTGEIGMVAIAVEVRAEKSDTIVTYCNDSRPWVREAFMNEAVDAVCAEMRSEDG